MAQQLQPWRVLWQQNRAQVTKCKRLTIVSENRKTGELTTMRPKMWEVHIRDSKGMILKVRLRLNEINQPTFTIEHNEKQVYQTIKTSTRRFATPIEDTHSPKLTVRGETEQFYNTKSLKNRIAGFAGMTFANEVVTEFITGTPLGE